MKELNDSGKIIVTGHPYAFPYYFKVFERLKNKKGFVFILPKLWLAKSGKIQLNLEPRSGFTIYGLKVASYGGHSIAGLFKGWLPGMIFLLPYLKVKFGSKVLYSCSEPNLLTTLYNGLIAKILGLKLVLFTWQNIPPEKRLAGLKLKLSNALVATNLKLTDGIICGNKKALEIIKKLQTTNGSTVLSSPSKDYKLQTMICPLGGVDTQKFRPGLVSDWKEKFGLTPNQKLILFYGALDSRKGLNILIEAFKMLITYQLPITKLVIIGTGSQKEKLVSLASELGIKERVIFLDWMKNEDLPAILNSADIFVYPSIPFGGWEEQFGYAMAEASACGVPVVATRTGSIDEVVIDGRDGILIEPNNPRQLADAIHKILSDDNLRKEMGEYGRNYIVKNFSHETIAGKISSFLLGL